MLRFFRIRTRLLLSFSVVVLFTLITGLTGYYSLSVLRTTAVRTINNVQILNDIYDYNIAVDSGLFNVLYVIDDALTDYIIQKTKEDTRMFLVQFNDYMRLSDMFRDTFTPGEMQDMENLFLMYKETYVPVVYEILDIAEHGNREKALAVYVNRFVPIYNNFVYHINMGFVKNLEYSAAETKRNSETAMYSAYVMLALVLVSLAVSVLLALAVTRSIAAPISELGIAAKKVARGELDPRIHFTANYSQGSDEIAYLSERLQETLIQLAQVQQLKLEAMEAMHEKEKAEASLKSKGEFLAKMSHEIRTPMNAITGMAELALRENMPNAAREHILTIKQAGANLLAIINDILDFSKIESGKLEIVPAGYLFSSLINDVISIVKMRFVDSQVYFVANIDSNIPNALYGDETRIRQIFLNVLSNAVKYTEKGFVSLTVMAEFPSGAADNRSVNLIVDVEDSGKGIRQEDLANLFDEFVQVDMVSNKGIEGTGLGLTITRSLVTAMGGAISVRSEYGKGSVFTITLPQQIRGAEKLVSVNEAEKKHVLVFEPRKAYADSIAFAIKNLGVACTLVSAESEFYAKTASGIYSFFFIPVAMYDAVRDACEKYESPVKIVLLAGFGETVANQNFDILTMPAYSVSVANTLNGITTNSSFSLNTESPVRFTAPSAKVLVVDDIGTNLKVAEGLLLPYKMQVDLCLNGPEAIKAVKETPYDLVFMDHMMPEMDGIEAVAAIRAWEAEQHKTDLRKQVPIIALTANVVSGMREMFIVKGFDDVLSKPVDVSKLDEILSHWLPREKRGEINKTDKKLIILVDDELANLRLGKNILSKEYTVFTAPSAEKLFGLLSNSKPDLILLDTDMPVVDGYDVMANLKSKQETRDIPVIFLTSPASPGSPASPAEVEKCLALGALCCIPKPFDPPAMFACIDKYI